VNKRIGWSGTNIYEEKTALYRTRRKAIGINPI